MTHPAQITDPAAALAYILAGNATVTVVSKKTDKRYTYQIKAPYDEKTGLLDLENDRRFVRLRVSADDWEYLGFFYHQNLNAGRKGNAQHPAFRALQWTVESCQLRQEMGAEMNPSLEVWHNGHCARCGRTLTVPTSIATGFGPTCAQHLGIPMKEPSDA
jgi:hypothetical protein